MTNIEGSVTCGRKERLETLGGPNVMWERPSNVQRDSVWKRTKSITHRQGSETCKEVRISEYSAQVEKVQQRVDEARYGAEKTL